MNEDDFPVPVSIKQSFVQPCFLLPQKSLSSSLSHFYSYITLDSTSHFLKSLENLYSFQLKSLAELLPTSWQLFSVSPVSQRSKILRMYLPILVMDTFLDSGNPIASASINSSTAWGPHAVLITQFLEATHPCEITLFLLKASVFCLGVKSLKASLGTSPGCYFLYFFYTGYSVWITN